jgi:hypothetical protein
LAAGFNSDLNFDKKKIDSDDHVQAERMDKDIRIVLDSNVVPSHRRCICSKGEKR